MWGVAAATLGVLARLLVWWGGGMRAEPWEYDVIARGIVETGRFGYTLHGTWYQTFINVPYTYLCAGLYAIFGPSPVVVLVFQWLVSAAGAFGAHVLGARLFGHRAGPLAAALIALHPGLVYYDARNLHPLGFDAALVVWSVVALLWHGDARSARRGAVAGLVHGVAIFERGTLLALPALTVVRSAKGRYGVRIGIVYLLACTAVVAPWLLRSVAIYGAPILTTTDGETVWRGNNSRADGGAFDRERRGTPLFDTAPEDFRRQVFAADELGQRRLFVEAARQFVATRPDEALRLFVHKLWGFWWFMPQSGIAYPPGYLRGYRAYYLVACALALAGMARALGSEKVRSDTLAILVLLASVSLIHAVFLVEIRHRWGVEPLVLVFAAGGATWLFDRSARRRPASP